MNFTVTNFADPRSSALPPAPGVPALAAAPAARPAVLLALFERSRPRASLLRAVALARVLDAELHVVRVLPDRTRANMVFPQNNLKDAVRTMERTLRAGRATRRWLASYLGAAEAEDRFALAHGDFVEQVALHAAELDAALIVVPARERDTGRLATSLARKSRVPVLVARSAGKRETIVAATDLESAGYPVLRRAAELGQRLDAPVVAVHNVDPVPVVVDIGAAWPVTVLPGQPIQEVRSAHLDQVSRELPVEASAVVREELSPVDAILGEARRRDADVVVVGTRRRGWLGRFVRRSVAAQVVDRAKRSVLVTPLNAAGPPARAVLARA